MNELNETTTFSIDYDGDVHLHQTDPATGKVSKVIISPEDIQTILNFPL